MYYLLLLAATALFSIQFVFNKIYQREVGATFAASCCFAVISAAVFGLAMLIVNRFSVGFTPFSALLALWATANGMLCGYFGILALSVSDLAKYSLWLMLGGMAVPFVYGILINGDAFTWQKAGCFLLIAAALFLNSRGGRAEKKGGALARISYAAIFLFNGLGGVIATIHQSPANTGLAVPTTDYTIICTAFSFAASGSVLLIRRIRGRPFPGKGRVTRKALFAAGAYGLVNGVANLLLMISIRHLEPSVQYPIITGGCVVLSVVFGLLFREKITARKCACAGITLLGTLLLLMP